MSQKSHLTKLPICCASCWRSSAPLSLASVLYFVAAQRNNAAEYPSLLLDCASRAAAKHSSGHCNGTPHQPRPHVRPQAGHSTCRSSAEQELIDHHIMALQSREHALAATEKLASQPASAHICAAGNHTNPQKAGGRCQVICKSHHP